MKNKTTRTIEKLQRAIREADAKAKSHALSKKKGNVLCIGCIYETMKGSAPCNACNRIYKGSDLDYYVPKEENHGEV